MFRPWLVLAATLCGAAWGAAPSYSAAGIVNVGNYAPGPFAPNSVVALFGTELSRSSYVLQASDIRNNRLPTELNFTQVLVDNIPTALLYVSETQVNFLIPSKQQIGDKVRIQVVRQGLAGPIVTISVVESAPALFAMPNGFAIATHADNSLITPEQPARGGETIVIYATGMGATTTIPATGELPPYVAQLVKLADLRVSVGGEIKYAGLTPGSAGLYQINLVLPANPGVDPEIRITIGTVSSAPGLKLAIR